MQVPLPHGGHIVSSVCDGVGTWVVVGGAIVGVMRTDTLTDSLFDKCCDNDAVNRLCVTLRVKVAVMESNENDRSDDGEALCVGDDESEVLGVTVSVGEGDARVRDSESSERVATLLSDTVRLG